MFLFLPIFTNEYRQQYRLFGAPGGIRTPNDGSEDRNDIHFTTGAFEKPN